MNVLLHPVAQSRAYRELLQHKTVFEWTTQREKEWKKLKETVSTEPVLTFFDPSKPKNICTDTSKDSLKKCATPNELRQMAACVICVQINDRDRATLCANRKRDTLLLGLLFGCGKFQLGVWITDPDDGD